MELNGETLKYEDELEKVINSNKSLRDKVKEAKIILENIAINEMVGTKLSQMVIPVDHNNSDNK